MESSMINRRFTVSASDLATGEFIIIENVQLLVDAKDFVGNTTTTTLYPKEFQIINDTGAQVEINFLKDVYEHREFLAHPERYMPIRVPDSFILQDEFPVSVIQKIVVRGTSGATHTSDLIIEMLKYSQ